jgi:hypothetical protein
MGRFAVRFLFLMRLPYICHPPHILEVNQKGGPSISDQGKILDLALSSLRARKKDDVFQFLSSDQKNTFQDGPKAFMQFVRTHLHAIYDHTTYRVLNQFMPSPGVIVHKVEFLDRDGHGTIGLIKMIKDETQNNTWRIDHFAVLYSESEREI